MFFSTFIIYTFFGITFISLALSSETPNSELSSRYKRMVGGVSSSIEEFPYLVALEWFQEQFCGGSILTPLHVVTAAHCFDGDNNSSSYQVRAGSSWVNRDGSVHWVSRVTVHPGYKTNPEYAEKHDVAVLTLVNPIEFDDVRRPIPMFEVDRESKDGSVVLTAGWGTLYPNGTPTDQLQSISLEIIEKNRCNESWWDDPREIQEGQICAGKDTQSPCLGDSGAPLVLDGHLAGVLSSGKNCTSEPLPMVFTEVSHYRKWIDEQIYEDGGQVPQFIYNWSIKKLDDVKKNIKQLRYNLDGTYDLLTGDWLTYDSFLKFSEENPSFKMKFHSRFNEVNERLKNIFGNSMEGNCEKILKNKTLVLNKKLYAYFRREVRKQYDNDFKLFDSAEKKCYALEEKVKLCLKINDDSCDQSSIQNQVSTVEKLVKYLARVTSSDMNFIFLKTSTYFSYVIDEYIFMPVNDCLKPSLP